MANKYKNLSSPIIIGDTVFRNRFIASRSSPLFLQGSETYPTEAVIRHYADKAKNGMGVVTCGTVGVIPFIPEDLRSSVNARTVLPGSYDIYDSQSKVYLSHLADAIHFYGSKASMQSFGFVPFKYDVSPGIPLIPPFSDMAPKVGEEEIPEAVMDEVAEDYVQQAVILKSLGFDMVHLHMAYRVLILGRFLSSLTNKRTDQYGGSTENRARFPIMVADRIKQACGKDFLIEASISGIEPPGGNTLDDAIEFAGLFAGHIDLLQLRGPDIDSHHTVAFNPEPYPWLKAAEAVKKSGADIAVVAIGGFQDPEVCEDVIASGKADFIAMARGIISNPDYGRLVYQGRGDDIVPCIRCNFCLRSSPVDPLVSVCSVNPTWGMEYSRERMVEPPRGEKKIAIIGGGPAGMKAALVSAARGHDVTLYEKSNTLGGLLKTADHVSFKWALRSFTHYLVRQISKTNVKVLLNREATPEVLKKEHYDVAIASVGSEPIVPGIPGIERNNVIYALDVYGNEAFLGKNIVIIGGGEVGVETGMHLAEKGHEVTVLEMENMLAPHAPPLHFYTMFKETWEALPGFHYILRARATGIETDGVTYVDADNREHGIGAESVVIAMGMKPKNRLALKFYDVADRFYMIGDCNAATTVQKAIRSAYSTASML